MITKTTCSESLILTVQPKQLKFIMEFIYKKCACCFLVKHCCACIPLVFDKLTHNTASFVILVVLA